MKFQLLEVGLKDRLRSANSKANINNNSIQNIPNNLRSKKADVNDKENVFGGNCVLRDKFKPVIESFNKFFSFIKIIRF